MKAAVIGSGIGGLATAIRLASRGYEVTVFEKNSHPGGKLSELRKEGFRFDTGPSLFTLPELVQELFTLCGENMNDKLPAERLEINCRYFFEDGMIFDFYHDKNELTKEINEKTKDKPEALFRRLNKSKEVYEISAPVFVFTAFHKLSNFNTPPYKQMAFRLHKLNFFRTMHGANKSDFKDKRLIQIFDRYATYNGSSPYRAPATLNMIAHLENNIGAYFPCNGMYSIVGALYNLAVRQGVVFHFNTPVKKILTEGKKALGLQTGEGKLSFDIVISDIDVKQVSRNLLASHPLRKRLEKAEPSSSALIFYWGINKKFPQLELHNILFSEHYKEEFRKLFNEHTILDDPTIYIFISSKIVKDDAPEGSENWFVMVNAPSNTGQDWDSLITKTRHHIIRKINRILSVDIGKHIVTETIGSPVTIEQDTGSVDGALYGTSSNSMFSAFLRHPNFLGKYENVYFTGGSAHPGGGIPLCLASAKIVDDEIRLRYE